MQGFFAQISKTLATDAAVMEDGAQLVCVTICFLLGRFAAPRIFRAFDSRLGGATKMIDDKTSEVLETSADSHPGLALLLEHYGVLGAPRGSWSGRGETTDGEPSVEEVSEYFRAALAGEACPVGAASSERHPAVPSYIADAPSGLELLEHYGIFDAPCGSWSCREETESEPSLDEVSDYFQTALADEGLTTH